MNRSWSCWALVGLVVAFGLTYSSIAQAQQVVINEIHYRPNDPAASPPEDIEFLELYNTGAAPLDISGWRFNQGVTYAFPAGTTIAGNGFVLVSKNGALLQATVTIPVGVPVFTWTTGQSLENAGEAVQLVNAASAVIDLVTYRDGGAWPEEPDGGGPSLELTHPANDNAYGQMWRASLGLNGTPGTVNSRYTEAPLVLWEDPARSSLTPNLTQIRVTFSEPVSGVAAADLAVAGAPATAVSCDTCTGGVGAGPYTFTGFPVPALPRFTVQLAPGAIQDGASNPFGGDSWTYRTSLPKIVINEIHYNPISPDPELEEFLELHNWGTEAIDIGRWRVVDFADPGCEFPAGTIVPAGGYVVCAKDPATLLAVTGYSTPYSWGASDALSNGGETVRLIDDALITIDIVPYDDTGSSWPAAPDGSGPSLELRNPTYDNANPASWRSSLGVNGTPGAQNSTYISAPVLSAVTPGRGTVAPALTQIEVTFSEPVTGVSADDLTVNAVQAAGVTGSGAGPYLFTVADSPAARMDVILATGGIQNAGGTPFGGDRWIYFDHAPRVVINELHYHPADGAVGSTEDAEQLQFLELYNADEIEFDLAGWSTSGVTYGLPPGTTLAPGAFLLLAKDEAFLRSKLPIPAGVTVLQWTSGDLSNGGETILLSDAYGNVIDQLTYDDEGLWPAAADGTGPSLELLNPGLPNEHGSVWRPSLAWNGTPGAANSVYDPVPAPVISQPAHAPPIPLPGQSVTIAVTVVDDGAAPPTVTLYHRLDANDGNFHNPNAYTSVAMLDDGLHGDGAAGDLRYGALVAGLADGQQLDFYITAGDGVKTAVAPTLHDTPNAKGNPSQTYLAKFSSEVLPTDFPVYHILVTLANKQWQESLTGEIEMKMDFDSTFIDDQLNIYYNVIERYRGQSSIATQPRSYRVDLPSDRPMDSPLGFPARKLQFNGHFALRQRLGYELFRAAGIPAPRTAWVRLRYTGINYDTSYIGSSAHRGLYALVERIDSDFMDSQDGLVVPPRELNSAGSLYRGEHDANLRWEGWDPNAYRTDADGRNGYSKENNEEQDYWDDLIPMIDALNNYPDPEYAPRVADRVDEEEWGGFYALHTVLGNREGGIYRDTGDDYYMGFNPPGDPNGFNCRKIPWDLDAVLTDGNETIWRQNVAAVSRFLRHDAFAPYYLSWLRRLLANEFSQAQMDALIDAQPAGAFAPSGGSDTYPETRQQYKNWTASRRAFVENELKDALTVTGIPESPYTGTNAVLSLSGNLEQGYTFAVTVNGQPADPNFYSGTWAGTHTLTPGMNTIVVAALDRDGAVLQEVTNQVFYNPPGTQHDSLRLILPKRMYNQKTMTIAADIIDVAGGVNWKVWEAVGTVSVVRLPDRVPVAITTTNFDPHVNDPNGSIRFYNGRGSVSFTLDDGAAAPAGTYELTVSVTVSGQPLTGTATITVLSAPAFRTLSGTLSGANLTWGPDEEIHLTGSVTVPAGSTLTIHPGTLVMIDAGSFQSGTLISVYGSLYAVGTQHNPIFLFPTSGAPALALTQSGSASNGNCWRGIDLHGTGSSTMRWIFLTGAGNGDVISHPRPPIVATRDRHTVNVDYGFFIDNDGMVFSAPSPGRFTIRNSVFHRAGIGAEFQSDGNYLLLEDSYFARIGHAPEPNNLDGDHLHIDGGSSDQTIRRCIFNDGGDDGIDHVAANFRVEDTILHDIRDKCISMTGGLAHVKNFLCFGSGSGIRGTADGENVTINVGAPIGGIGPAGLKESIIWPSSYGSALISYSDLGNPADAALGTANFSADPLFKGSHDFDLQPGSPALTAGPGGTRVGWLGWPYAGTCATVDDCGDGNACTYDECIAQQCVYTPIANCAACESDAQCDDDNACTDDACDLGTCRYVNNTGPCDDGSACTADDQCAGGACSGLPVTCNDLSACTIDSCNPAAGCEYVPIACDDANPCTDDSCSAATGCVFAADNTNACTDGVACTSDACSAGSCISTSTCGAGLTCNLVTGQCSSEPVTVTFQDGVGGYAETWDTFIDAALGSQATVTPIVVDGSPVEQVLLRFDGIFGPGAGQVPPGATITAATLTLRVGGGTNDQSTNAVNFHRLLHPWSDAGVWADYGVAPWNAQAGLQADGVDALAAVEASSTMSAASTAYGVSVIGSLQAWSANPSANYGWAILPTGTDGLRLESSESATAAFRPLLSVTYLPPATTCTTDGQCDDGLFCNGTETCNLGTGTCQPGTPPDCADAHACTTEGCNEATDTCDHVPDNASCSDGNSCTDDVCSPTLGCQYTNNTSSCSDGDACTTADSCSGGACVGGPAPDCDDGVACTIDSCDAALGCRNLPDCPSGQSCNPVSGTCEASSAPPLPIAAGAPWRLFKGTTAPPADWRAIAFDDAAWSSGPSGFGYGTDCAATRGTELADMQNGYTSLYVRRSFSVSDAARVLTLTLTIDFDDGFVAYLNGTEVARSNVTGTPPAHTALATADHECSACNSTCNPAGTFDLTAYRGLLVNGTNVLAIQAHNRTSDSTDFTLLPTLSSTEGAGCLLDSECNDSNPCTDDTCNVPTGQCVFTPDDGNACSDGIACTTDTCAAGACSSVDACPVGQDCNLGTGECQVESTTVAFQQGTSGYAGQVDTFLHAGSPDANNAAAATLIVDGPWTNPPAPADERQTLVRFNGLFASEGGPIPNGSTISSATLAIYVSNVSDDGADLHRMKQPWADTATWNALVGGVQIDGTEAESAFDASGFTTAFGTYTLDVRASLQAWSGGAPNYGWVFVSPPNGSDSWQFDSAEGATIARRPQLTVTYVPPIASCTTNEQCQDGNLCDGTEVCDTGTCREGTPLACDNGTVCDGIESCNPASGCVPGTPLTCDDGLACNGVESCNAATGCVAGTAIDCSDGIACTADSCTEPAGLCSHTQCPMTAVAAGSRYVDATPPAGVASVALRVSSAGLACLPQYVAADGTLSATPVYQSSAAWGTAHLRGQPITPSRLYSVEAVTSTGQVVGSASATTWLWGDVNNSGDVDLYDILCVLDGTTGSFLKCPIRAVDLRAPAELTPDGAVTDDDVHAVQGAFASDPYPDTDPCSGSGR